MTTKQKEQKIAKFMEKLGCSREEALDIIATDETIDKGGRTPYDLSVEQEKEAKKIGAVKDRKAKDQENNMRGKVRAENPTKANIVTELAEFLTENGKENVKITNKERMIAFSVGETNFELTLVQKRAKKS